MANADPLANLAAALADFLDSSVDDLWQAPDPVPVDVSDEEGVPEPVGFLIADANMANWALAQLARLESDLERVEKIAEAERHRIDQYVTRHKTTISRKQEFLTTALKSWFEVQQAADPRLKTVDLPNGTLQERRSSASAALVDEQALMEWLKVNRPDLIRVKESPKWADVKKVVEIRDHLVVWPETGEIVPGVMVEPAATRFFVKPRPPVVED